MIATSHYESPVGRLVLAEKDSALIGLWIQGQKYFFSSLRGQTQECDASPVLVQVKRWLDRYFMGKMPSAGELPLAPAGSEFRREVWSLLCEIPYGETVSYGELSQKIAAGRGLKQMSAQAVGGAVSHNPISIIIPCHRVIGSSGSLTGYAGGLQKKIQLLTHEGVDTNRFFIPRKGTAL